MSSLRKAIASLALLSSFGTASAIPVTDSIDPTPDITISVGSPYLYVHDISDGAAGYVADYDTLVSALLTINLIDNVSQGHETFQFVIGSGGAQQVVIDNGPNAVNNGQNATPYPITLVAALSDLAADGKLSVTLSASTGDYIFTSSVLSAEVTRGVGRQQTTAVPEPATLALLGLGLFGIVAMRKRQG
jgi:hypothetical protein